MANIPTDSWDETYPAGSTKISKGDDAQRQIKTQFREIISVDHDMESSGQGTDWGQHKQVTLQEQADLGTGAVNATILGSQTVSGKGELVYTDEDDNDVQITSSGYINTAGLNAGALPTGVTVASANIVNGTIVNADINASAAIDATKIHDGSISNTEFGYLNGVTSAIQTQIDGKERAADYDSGWISQPADITLRSAAHGMGAIPSRFTVMVQDGSYVSPVILPFDEVTGDGMSVTFTSTHVYYRKKGTTSSWLTYYYDSSNVLQQPNSGNIRIKAWL